MASKTQKALILNTLAIILLVAAIVVGNWPFSTVPTALVLLAITSILASAFFVQNQGSKSEETSGNWRIEADALTDAVLVTDVNGTIKGINKAWEELLPYAALAGTLSDIMEPLHSQSLDRQTADEVVNAVLSAPEINFTDRLNLNDGRVIERTTRTIAGSSERIWMLRDVTQAIVANNDSAMHQTMVEEDAARTAELAEQLFHAKAELEKKQTELTKLANTDPMTGLWNRRRFLSLAEEAIKASGTGQSLWVIMMDIDHFKRVNDTYGHAAGDVAIRDFSNTISSCVGDAGCVGRLGGEEFAAILKDCPVDEAYRIAEKIRSTTTEIQTKCGAEVFRFTTSIGIAPWMKGETSIEPALDRSDKALYSAKAYGRNRVVGYE